MKRHRFVFSLTSVLFGLATSAAHAQYAAQAISYNPGSTSNASYNAPLAALGSPERFTGEGVFPSIVSPFSPPYLSNELLSVGKGGQITLRLSNYLIPQPSGGPELGLFTNAGIIDIGPLGQAGSPAAGFDSPPKFATVEVSADGSSWTSLGDVTLDIPANGYTDVTNPYASSPGSVLSDFQQPFTGSLNSFSGLPFSDPSNPDVLELLAGSGGGKWIDVSSAGLSQIGYVRLSLASGLAGSPHFELDAVSIAHAALGAPNVPEPTTLVGVATLIPLLALRRRRA